MATETASGYSYIKYTSNGSDVNYLFSFDYISEDHINVSLDGTDSSDFEVLDDNSINLYNAATAGVDINIYRTTPIESPIVSFSNASSLNKEDLNKNDLQNLYVMQEIIDDINIKLGDGVDEATIYTNLDMNLNRIVDLADAVDDYDAVNLSQVQSLISEINAGTRIEEQEFTATEGQTDFVLTDFTYQPGYKTIIVFIDGIAQSQTDFTEINEEKISLDEGCNGSERVVIRKNDAPSTSVKLLQSAVDVLGGVLLASETEANAGVDTEKVITPATLAYTLARFLPQDGTTDQKGVVQLATSADSGSDKAATPDSVTDQISEALSDKFIVSSSTPDDADGNPNGTVVFVI